MEIGDLTSFFENTGKYIIICLHQEKDLDDTGGDTVYEGNSKSS